MHANPGDEPISGEIRLASLWRPEGTTRSDRVWHAGSGRSGGVELAHRNGDATGTGRLDSRVAPREGWAFTCWRPS